MDELRGLIEAAATAHGVSTQDLRTSLRRRKGTPRWPRQVVSAGSRDYEVYPDFWAAKAKNGEVLRILYEEGCPRTESLLLFMTRALDFVENDNEETRSAIYECTKVWLRALDTPLTMIKNVY